MVDEKPKASYNKAKKKVVLSFNGKKVTLVANRKTMMRRVKTGITKFIGEKYNPYAFVIEKTNIKARNYTGGIFQY